MSHTVAVIGALARLLHLPSRYLAVADGTLMLCTACRRRRLPVAALYAWLVRIRSIADLAPDSRRLSGRNAHDAATSTAIDSAAAPCHHSPPVAIEADAAPVRSNMIPAYAHSLIIGNPGTRIAVEPSTFQMPSRTMKWTGNPSATAPWTTSGTCIAYASPPDPMRNATSPVQTQ